MSGFIYAFESDGAVKIGWSMAPSEREIWLRSSLGGKGKMIGFVKGSQKKEKELHRKFSALNIGGEWFRKEGEIIDFIKDLPQNSIEIEDQCATIHVRIGAATLKWLDAEWQRRGAQSRAETVRAVLDEARGRR